jgi:hypothetical protein
MKIFLLLFLLCSLITLKAQYTTPGTGVIWNMDSLVQKSSAVQYINSGNYRVVEDLTISANDSVFIIDNNIRFANGVQLTVSGGSLYIQGGVNTGKLIADVQGQTYKGFRLEGNANVTLEEVTINDCGGIKVLTPNFIIMNSNIEYNVTDINTSGFIELSNGKPQILNNEFRNNEVSAISSAANATVAPVIRGNLIEGNVTSNSNKPQINLSPSGVNDTTYIENNTITGSTNNEMAGGIAFSALAGGVGHVVIRNNQISNNRYGITILGNNLSALIDNNEIRDNNIQNAPNLGGSGINFNGNSTSSAIVSNNQISGNLWGVTIQATFSVNLGDSHIGGSNPGLNTFSENSNGGETYALFNNTPSQVYATNNCWEINVVSSLQNAESVISHQVDDNSLGEVIFNPISFCNVVGVNETENNVNLGNVFPNPTSDIVYFNMLHDFEVKSIELVSLLGGNILLPFSVEDNEVKMDVSSVASGIYLLTIRGENLLVNQRLIIE